LELMLIEIGLSLAVMHFGPNNYHYYILLHPTN